MVGSRRTKRALSLASSAILGLVPDVSLMIKFGRLSEWFLFSIEFFILTILVVSALYLAFAGWDRFVSSSDPDRYVSWYPFIAIIALVLTNILAHVVVETLLIRLQPGG